MSLNKTLPVFKIKVMKNKNLFDDIRDNQHKLDQLPSRDAWTKLEARLDAQERPAKVRRLPLMGLISVAASVLLLVGLVFVASQTLLPMPNRMAQTESIPLPQSVEDLPLLASNEPVFSAQMAEYQRRINANPRGLIKEGGYHKKLVAQNLNPAPATYSTTNSISINSFDWLLGTWNATLKEGISSEKWEAIAPDHYIGTGTFTTNGTAIFSEKMALRQINGQLFFEAETNEAGTLVRYSLEKYDGERAVFSNKNIDFPSHVIIQRNNANGFTISFENVPPIEIPATDFQLKNQRNQVESNAINRVMKKVEI